MEVEKKEEIAKLQVTLQRHMHTHTHAHTYTHIHTKVRTNVHNHVQAMDELERRVLLARNRFHQLMNDACPKCGQAFQDFTRCAALSCASCVCFFFFWN